MELEWIGDGEGNGDRGRIGNKNENGIGQENRKRIKKKEEKNLENKIETVRTCTKCLVDLPVTEFYSMGNRMDSWCKCCKKQKRKTTYVSSKNSDIFGRIRTCFEMIHKIELDQLNEINVQLERMITKCQYSAQQ